MEMIQSGHVCGETVLTAVKLKVPRFVSYYRHFGLITAISAEVR